MSQPHNRRVFLRRAAVAGASTIGLGHFGGKGIGAFSASAPSGNQAENAPAPFSPKSRPDVILHRGGYPGWPWVARTRQGRLVCVFRDDGVHGFSPAGKILWTASEDAGVTWSPAQVVVDQPEVDDRNAAVVELPDGTWMVPYNTYSKDLVSQCMVTTSRDGGATWSRPRPITPLDARTRGAPIALSSGDVLIPIYKAPGNGSIAARSADGGKTWELARLADTEGFVGDEWVVVEVEPGRTVGILRNNGARDGHFWKTESRDGGRTWDVPVQTNVRDARSTSPAHLDLHGKTPVLTYADQRMVSVSMATTDDSRFLRWDVEGRLSCYQYRPDGRPIADASYPVSAFVGEHRRLIVDYEIRDEGKWIAGYFVELPDHWR